MRYTPYSGTLCGQIRQGQEDSRGTRWDAVDDDAITVEFRAYNRYNCHFWFAQIRLGDKNLLANVKPI